MIAAADGTFLMFNLCGGVVCGLISMAIASGKGRSMVGWFFVGFLAGIIGIIVAACMSNLKEEEARRQMTEMEQRRLREQLRQEQMKTESYRRYTVARLDAHDQVLGVDTRSQPQLLTGDNSAPRAQLPSDPADALSQMGQPIPPIQQAPVQFPNVSQPAPAETAPSDGMQWYYERQGQTIGPVAAHVISGLLTSGRIAPATLVWCQDFTEWTPANRTVAFAEAAGA